MVSARWSYLSIVGRAGGIYIEGMFTHSEIHAARSLIILALVEDLGEVGDITSQAFIPATATSTGFYIARKPGVLAGLEVAKMVCAAVSEHLTFEPLKSDGETLAVGDKIAKITGPSRDVLAAERTSLNFLQRLSGVATLTSQYVKMIEGTHARILDTRKTTPGWRLLEKYAVRMGGGKNHRIGLYDAILIKDNHLVAMNLPTPQAAVEAVRKARDRMGYNILLTVEVDDLATYRAVLPEMPDIILLDNIPLADLRSAVGMRNAAKSSVQLEASGGVNFSTVRDIAQTGVDRISIGALTHSAVALDIALDF
jgi:nicotinate-nucleotide pyrophosphorylase (carboxylating)